MGSRPGGRLHPAEVAQLRANLAAHGLSPAALARGSRPVVFADVVSTGTSCGQLLGILRDWAADERAEWTRALPAGAVRNVSLDSSVFSYFAGHQQQLTRSFGRGFWADGEVRTPARDHRTRRAPAEAAALVEAGRSPAVRARPARTMSREPAIAEPWLRDLVRRLPLRASPA